jgi:hypothetical protein
MTLSGADPVSSLVLPAATERGEGAGLAENGHCLAGYPDNSRRNSIVKDYKIPFV